jgi:hypothetical protein
MAMNKAARRRPALNLPVTPGSERDTDLGLYQPVVSPVVAATDVFVGGVLPARAEAQVQVIHAVVQVGTHLPGEHVGGTAAGIRLDPAECC